jgi:integrase
MGRRRVGVRRHRGKLKAYVDVLIDGQPRQKTKSFPVDTDPTTIEAWRTLTKGQYGRRAIVPGSLADLVADYLPIVHGKPTADQIAAHLQLWLDALGADRTPASVTGLELSAIMRRWLSTATNQPDPMIRGRRGRPSAPSGVRPATVKKRRATLRRMFNVMAPTLINPVRASICPRVSTVPDERGIPVADVLRLIAAMPEWRYPRKGIKVPCGARLRAGVMLWCGLPPGLIGQVGRDDLTALSAAVPTVRVSRREKGEGVESRDVEQCPQAVAAWHALAAGNALGPFEPGPFNVSVKRAARRAGIPLPPGFHAYDIRHVFGAALAFSGASETTIARLMMHAAGSTVGRRYTQAAHRAVAAQSVTALGHFGEAAATAAEFRPGSESGNPAKVQDRVHEPAQKPARLSKPRKVRHLRRVS